LEPELEAGLGTLTLETEAEAIDGRD
jgi:hypothetical protein